MVLTMLTNADLTDVLLLYYIASVVAVAVLVDAVQLASVVVNGS